MSNKSAGTAFERELAGILAANGFWVHRFQDNKNGQPCDLIAAKNGTAFLIDCKDCSGSLFELRRLEENQLNAMWLFERAGNAPGRFAVRIGGEIFMMDHLILRELRLNGVGRMSYTDCELHGRTLRAWIRDTQTPQGRPEGGRT